MVKNNIFFECGSKPENNTYGWYAAPEALTDFVGDFNFVCGPNGSKKRSDAGSTRLWRFREPNGVNGGDPGFVELSYLQLASNSILKDRGETQTSFADDYFKRPRLPGFWDIGAAEAP